jgi:tetratricopeptide (TPR) repeat protein
MKRLVCTLVSVFTLTSAIANGTYYQEVFLRANKLYKEGAYENALEAYNSIQDKGAAVWYNSGNCLYKLGNYIDALVAFKRALLNASYKQRTVIKHNIEQTLLALNVSSKVVDSRFRVLQVVIDFTKWLTAMTSLLFLQLLFLFLLYATFFCVWYLQRSQTKSRIIIGILGTMTTCSAIALIVKYDDTLFTHGIVTHNQASIFVGPDKKYHMVATVGLADELIILEKSTDWYKVKKGRLLEKDHLLGWIPAEYVAEIN